MTVTASIDPARLLEEQLAQASPDLLRELLTTFVNTHDEWAEGRRYLGLDVLARAQAVNTSTRDLLLLQHLAQQRVRRPKRTVRPEPAPRTAAGRRRRHRRTAAAPPTRPPSGVRPAPRRPPAAGSGCAPCSIRPRRSGTTPPMDPGDDLSDPITLITDPAKSVHNPNNPTITAGFTFLGQFLDHDMTFDPTSSLARQQDPESIRNFRIPALDLDSVYGGGPGASPQLYDQTVDGDGPRC
jgi:hypothetical protein